MKDESKTDVVVTTYDALKSGMNIQPNLLYAYAYAPASVLIYYLYMCLCIYVRYAQCLPPPGVAQYYPRRGA